MIERYSAQTEKFWEVYKSVDNTQLYHLHDFLDRFAVNFNLYKDGAFIERSLPFDFVPRIIPHTEFITLEKGLKQRITALNMFLSDIYGGQRIIRDNVIPAEFVYRSKGLLPQFQGFSPPKAIHTHISGIDLVKDTKTDKWLILEDNLRVPSGVSYPLSIREAYRKVYPEFFESFNIYPTKQYPQQLRAMMDHVNVGGVNVILTPGRYNSAFYEHSYLARETDATLVTNGDLEVKHDKLYLKKYNGERVRVGAVYRRLDDDFLDPLEFNPQSMIGVPNLINVYRSGNVAIINAIGNGVADDKGIYYFVPKMIKYYLGEEPLIDNAPTYLPYYDADRNFVLANIEKLVIKDVSEAGGYGVLFGSKLNNEKREEIRQAIIAEPRKFIAQELVEFYDIECMIEGELKPRKSDLRIYALYGQDIKIMPGGLTRYALEAGNYLVNSSQGGGFKDTWVVEL